MAYSPYYQPYYNPISAGNIPDYRSAQMPNPLTPPVQSDIIWVMGESGAKAYPVAPNNTVTLWDRDSNLIYLKSCDASGIPSMRTFEWKEKTGAPSSESAGDGGFVKISDFEAAKAKIADLEKRLATFIENAKEKEVTLNG